MPAKKVFLDIFSAIWEYGGVSFFSASVIWIGLWALYKKQNIWILVLLTYIFIILNFTLIDREYVVDPFKYLMKGFSFFYKNGSINYEPIENCIMLVPLIPLVGLSGRLLKAWQSFLLCFGFSSFIEIMQGVFHLGSTQFSDVVFNTFGGMVGWLIYKVVLAIVSHYLSC